MCVMMAFAAADVAVRTIILLQPDDVLDPELPLEIAHVADFRTPKAVDGLIVVADTKQACPLRLAIRRQQLQPLVLEAVGILKLIDQDMTEAILIVTSYRFVTLQQLIGTQQQFCEVDNPPRAGTGPRTRCTAPAGALRNRPTQGPHAAGSRPPSGR